MLITGLDCMLSHMQSECEKYLVKLCEILPVPQNIVVHLHNVMFTHEDSHNPGFYEYHETIKFIFKVEFKFDHPKVPFDSLILCHVYFYMVFFNRNVEVRITGAHRFPCSLLASSVLQFLPSLLQALV